MPEVVDFLRSIWGLWLMSLFLGVIAWAYWPRNRARFDAAAMIPLNDDDPPTDKR
ncbi:MAG: cbb3-type cytochrome c oxidase subunit 3 [Rhodospirillaceae bacterium]|nr:cbb3-type cytochrome c oxidase subunit 3 [Rhodospirillaceae bacterium]